MSNRRSTSLGNARVDLTKIRESLKDVPPGIQSTLRNVVASDERTGVTTGKDSKHINPFKLERLSNVISNNINAVTDLREITPYIDKAELIWNTILLYPNGKQEEILSYDTKKSSIKSSALHNELLSTWKEYFTNDYKIDRDLRKIISDVMWSTGSHVLFNLSRPGLDYLINGSERTGVESLNATDYSMVRDTILRKEFVEQDGSVRVRNKGVFVRNPNNTKVKQNSVGGLEDLLALDIPTEETEFNIFENELAKVMNVTLTDNPSILFLQKINEVKKDLGVGLVTGVESLDNVIKRKRKKPEKPIATTKNPTREELEEFVRDIYPERDVVNQSLQYVKSNDALSVAPYGRGLTWHVPSEAVIPIHYQGSNDDKLDYIFLLDEDGNFLKNTSDAEFYQSSKQREEIANQPKSGSHNQLIASLRTIQEGKECDFDMSEFIEITKDSIIKRFMTSIISNRGDNISISIDEETNKIFLARLFKKQGVRCLYVPGEAVTYIALKYNKLGIGQSLTQSAKMHIARLAAFDLADALANLQGAQPHSLLTITPEEYDDDPQRSIAIARAKYFGSNPRLHGLLSSAQLSIPQIVDALKESSLTVKVQAGDNPHVVAPDVSVDRMDKESFKPVDDNSRQGVLNQIANYFHLPRSWLDVTDDQNDFRIEAVTEHELVYNQAVFWQEKLSEGIIDFERKHARVNGPLLESLVEVITDNKSIWTPDSKESVLNDLQTDDDKIKLILNDFLSNIYCELPTPVSVDKTNKLIDSVEAVERLVTAWEDMSGSKQMMESVLKTLGIEIEGFDADEIKKAIKSVFLVEGFRRFNLPMPFDEIINDGKGGGIASLVTSITDHNKNLSEFLTSYVTGKVDGDKKIIKSNKNKLQKKLSELSELMEGSEEAEEAEEPIGGGDDDVESADEEGDAGDASGEDDADADETEPEEEPEEEEPVTGEPVAGDDEDFNPFA